MRPQGPPGADRISDLPDELLLRILSFLRFRDAVSTARLSRRWRYLWHYLPSLDFSTCEWGDEQLSAGVVDRALVIHAAPRLDRLRLRVRAMGEEEVGLRRVQIDSWLLVAVRRCVRVLDLDFMVDTYFNHDEDYADPNLSYGLPHCLFGCGSLEALFLRFCHLRLPSHVRLGSLKTMNLSWVYFRGHDLKLLLAGCPLLQSLRLVDCNVTSNLDITAGGNRYLQKLEVYETTCPQSAEVGMEICAPSLKYLSFCFSIPRAWYRVRDLSALVAASFDLDESLDGLDLDGIDRAFGDFTAFAQLLEQIRGVQVLKMCSWCLQALSVREMQGLCVPSCFNVTVLELSLGLQKWELPGFFGAFRACDKLRILNINIKPKETMQFKKVFLDEYDFDETEYLRSSEPSFGNVMQHLKVVMIQGFVGYRHIYQKERSIAVEDYNLDECRIFDGHHEEVIKNHEEKEREDYEESVSEVSAAEYMFRKGEMEIFLVGFLLKVSPVLEKLIVKTSSDLNKQGKRSDIFSKLSYDLLSLPRSSPNAQVIVKGN